LFENLKNTRTSKLRSKMIKKLGIEENFGKYQRKIGNMAAFANVENEYVFEMRGGKGLLHLSGASSPLKLPTTNPK